MISNETFHRARKLPLVGHKVHLVQNGIEEHAQQSRDEARADLVTRCPTLGTVRNAPWIGTIAELHPNKRVEILIDALIALRGHGIEAELVIIGDGERAGALREHSMASPVSAHVHFLGFVPDAARTIPAFDLFTLASVKEGLPYVLIECASAGCPAVVTDIGGNRDVVKDGMNGLLVEPDAESFARAYERILKDGSTARSMGDAARRVFAARFTLVRMVHATHALYVSPKPSNSRS
jgi:glycosyltransferase involved in cell wall biosynthesis